MRSDSEALPLTPLVTLGKSHPCSISQFPICRMRCMTLISFVKHLDNAPAALKELCVGLIILSLSKGRMAFLTGWDLGHLGSMPNSPWEGKCFCSYGIGLGLTRSGFNSWFYHRFCRTSHSPSLLSQFPYL